MLYILLTILFIFLVIPFGLFYKNKVQYNNVQKPFKQTFIKSDNKLPKFDAKELAFNHSFIEDGITMPFLDIKKFEPFHDGRTAIIQTGGAGQNNVVLLNENGSFKDITTQLNLGGIKNEAAYSIAIADIDNDGKKEVLIGYASGVYMSKYNGTNYDEPIRIFGVPDASIPVDIVLSDTDGNGLLDIFVCTFVDKKNFTSATYHDLTNKRQNLFMVNQGDGKFEEKAEEAGLLLIENSYLAKFVDLNGNGLEDLVLASNTNFGRIYENLGNGKFKGHILPTEYGFWMGLSVEKLDESSDKYHILMSNIGKSYPVAIVRGDLKKDEVFIPNYALLEQVDGFNFKNVTKEKNIDSNVFGWGVAFVDLNNNGKKDAILTENYIKFPANIHAKYPSNGKVFLQNDGGTFAPFQEEIGLINPNFGYRILTGDFTNNGFNDVIIGNVNGPIKFFNNKGVE